MTTNILSVIEQQQKALILMLNYPEARSYFGRDVCSVADAALAAGQQALEQAQGESVSVDWQDMYWKQKRRAEMWIAKYEKDIGPLEKVHPQATEPAPSTAGERAGLVDCGECRTQGCRAGHCRKGGVA